VSGRVGRPRIDAVLEVLRQLVDAPIDAFEHRVEDPTFVAPRVPDRPSVNRARVQIAQQDDGATVVVPWETSHPAKLARIHYDDELSFREEGGGHEARTMI